MATSKELPFGDYIIKESKTPNGYFPLVKDYEFKIDRHDKVVEFTIENKPILVDVIVNKTGETTGKALPGAVFQLKKNGEIMNFKVGTQVISSLTTDSQGKIKFPQKLGVGKYELIEIKAPSGKNGEIMNFKVGTQVISSLTTDSQGKIKFPQKLGVGKYELIEIKAPSGYLSAKPVKFEITADSVKENPNGIVINVKDKEIKGDVKLVKVDEDTGKPMPNITFELFDKNDNSLGKYTTDENGVIEVKDLDDVKLVKVDEDTGKPMPNITFELFDKNDNSLGKYTTDENGVIEVKDLEYGEYYFKEVSKPHGYVEDTEKIYFMIQKDGQTITLNKTNKLIDGDVELTKVDIDTGETLSGVTFKLVNANTNEVVGTYTTDSTGKFRVNDLPFGKYYIKEITGETLSGVTFKLVNANTNEVVGTYTTDSTGKFRVNDLPFGKYYIKEIQGLEGYESDDSPEVFYIQESGELITITKYNKKIKGKIQINKTDVSDGKVIPDCGFRIWKDDKKTIVIEGKTDKNGIAEFELGYGKYYYQEFDAPEGYVLDNRLYPFEIKENGEIVKAHMTNEKIKGTMELSKVDISNGMLIPNAKFKIYKEDKKTVVVKGMTDQNGIAKFNLEYGKYYYQEYDAPNGYILDESLFPFEIKINGDIVKCQMTNKPETGGLIINKVDGKTGESLQGAILDESLFPFEIKINGDIVKCQMTNKPETGGLIINKVDGKTGESLQGATFGLYCSKSKVLEGVTDQNGRLEITGLSIGTYTLKEEKAPAGYQNLNQQFEIKIDEINEVETLKVCGRLEITGLSIGTYTLKEEKAPAGYQNLNQQFEIKIDEINEVETLKVCNWKYGVQAPAAPMKPLVQTGTVVTTGATLAGILSAGAYIFLRRRH